MGRRRTVDGAGTGARLREAARTAAMEIAARQGYVSSYDISAVTRSGATSAANMLRHHHEEWGLAPVGDPRPYTRRTSGMSGRVYVPAGRKVEGQVTSTAPQEPTEAV